MTDLMPKDNSFQFNSHYLMSQAREPYNIHQYPEDPIKASILSLYPKLLHRFFFVNDETGSSHGVWERGVKLPVSLLACSARVRHGTAIPSHSPEPRPVVVWLTNYQDPLIDDFPYQERFCAQGCEVVSFQKFLGPECRLKCLGGLSNFIGSYRSTLESVLEDLIPKTFGFFDVSIFDALLHIGMERRNVSKVWRAWCLHKKLTSAWSPKRKYLLVSRSGGEVSFSVLKGTLDESKRDRLRLLQISHAVLINPSKPQLPEVYAADSLWVPSSTKKKEFERKLVLNNTRPEISLVPRARSLKLAVNVREGEAIGIALTSDQASGHFISQLLNMAKVLTETFNRKVVIRPRLKSAHIKYKILDSDLSSRLENRLTVETSETIIEHLNKVKVALVVACPISRRVSNIAYDYLDVGAPVAITGTVADRPVEFSNFALDDISGIKRFIGAELRRKNDTENSQGSKMGSLIGMVDFAVKTEMSRF